MTRTYNERVTCPQCGFEHDTQTDFERWMRNHPRLDSNNFGLVRYDLDVLLHKYKSCDDGRLRQFMMFIEVKTHGANCTEAQRDTLHILNQVLRNRKPNRHQVPKYQLVDRPIKAFSTWNRKDVRIWLLGGHLLQFDGTYPDNSTRILWDHGQISWEQLIGLLRFEINPDYPSRKLDVRRRTGSMKQQKELFK